MRDEQYSWETWPSQRMVPAKSLVPALVKGLGLGLPSSDEVRGYGEGRRPIIATWLDGMCQVVFGHVEWFLRRESGEEQVPAYILKTGHEEVDAFVRLDLDSDPYSKGPACKVLLGSEALAQALNQERVTQEALGRLLGVSDATIGAWVRVSDMPESLREAFSPIGDYRALQVVASLPSEAQKELARRLPEAKDKRKLAVSFAKVVKSNPGASPQDIELALTMTDDFFRSLDSDFAEAILSQAESAGKDPYQLVTDYILDRLVSEGAVQIDVIKTGLPKSDDSGR